MKTPMNALRTFALRLPETEEGVACEGTALESRTVRTNGKAFLFLRPHEARLKLGGSLEDAARRAAKEPDRFIVGSGGWVQVKFDEASAPLDLLERWTVESHALFAAGPAATRGPRRRSPKPAAATRKGPRR